MDLQSIAPEMINLDIQDENGLNEENIFKNFFFRGAKEEEVRSKNVLLMYVMEKRISQGEYLKIPFRKYCTDCNGKGFHVLDREYGVYNLTCNFCGGTGVKTVPCKKCTDGIDENGNTCQTCKGEGYFRYYKNKRRNSTIPCPKCKEGPDSSLGHGFIEKIYPTGNILNWKICGKCEGTSIKPEFINKIGNLAIINDDNRPIHIELARLEMESVARKYIS